LDVIAELRDVLSSRHMRRIVMARQLLAGIQSNL
jgi:hypothetical protein